MTALNTAGQNSDHSVPWQRYILLFANNFIKLSVQLIVIFLYARSLSIVDYGLYQTVWLYVNILSVFFLFGLPNLILTYGLADIFNWVRHRKLLIVGYFFLINVLLLIWFFTQGFFFSWQTKLLLLLLIYSQNVAIIAETHCIKTGAEKKVLRINTVVAILFLVSHGAILQIDYSLPLLLACLVSIQLFKIITLLRLTRTVQKPAMTLNLGRQWLYIGLGDVLGVIYKWLDKWVILFFISLSQFALYFNGSYEIPVFMLMVSAIGNVLLVELAKDGAFDRHRIKNLFRSTNLMLASLVFPAFSFLFFYHESFFLFFFGATYAEAIPIFLISICVIPLRITNFTALLQSSHRSDLVLRGVIADLTSAILFMVLLYPWLGLRGIALSFVLSTYLQAIYYLRKTIVVTRLALSDFFPLQELFGLLIISFSATGIFYLISSFLLSEYILLIGVLSSLAIALILLSFNRNRTITR